MHGEMLVIRRPARLQPPTRERETTTQHNLMCQQDLFKISFKITYFLEENITFI